MWSELGSNKDVNTFVESVYYFEISFDLEVYLVLLKTSHGIFQFQSFDWFTGHGV